MRPTIVGDKKWKRGKCVRKTNERQYEIKLDSGKLLTRNRKDIRVTKENIMEDKKE